MTISKLLVKQSNLILDVLEGKKVVMEACEKMNPYDKDKSVDKLEWRLSRMCGLLHWLKKGKTFKEIEKEVASNEKKWKRKRSKRNIKLMAEAAKEVYGYSKKKYKKLFKSETIREAKLW